MTTGDKAKGNGCALIFVLIPAGIILIVTLWSFLDYYISTNPPDQYKTSIIFRGKQGMKVDCGNLEKCTPREMVMDFMYNTYIRYDDYYNGITFFIEVKNREHKEEALRLLQIGIDEGKIYTDEQNYLVTE